MKKTYFAPETEIVNVQVENLMSIGSNGDGTLFESLGDDQTTTENSGNLSRGSSLWDDDEE